ncbi:hypothetical protein PoMZ_02746 [Pyricularia oryzae]|uniref:Uncharacterized protein n=1 Tax=Pyricularia oryzae TaxID=318829 RepID=A0A4P7N936_PYROR|nr:hypothetical protein PoMZ_02746 [Pyricularia oryzae]
MAPPAKAVVIKNTGKSSNIIIGITDEVMVATSRSGTRGPSASASASKVGCRPGAWYSAPRINIRLSNGYFYTKYSRSRHGTG